MQKEEFAVAVQSLHSQFRRIGDGTSKSHRLCVGHRRIRSNGSGAAEREQQDDQLEFERADECESGLCNEEDESDDYPT